MEVKNGRTDCCRFLLFPVTGEAYLIRKCFNRDLGMREQTMWLSGARVPGGGNRKCLLLSPEGVHIGEGQCHKRSVSERRSNKKFRDSH